MTGAGSAVLESKGEGVRIRAVHIGTITDYGITDAGNMGAAMAPAAARTIHDLMEDSATTPADYDQIVTGDLGAVGTKLLYQLMEQDWGIQLAGHHKDCGMMIYDLKSQDVNAGGSGCGCGGSVLCSHILKKMEQGALRKVLFVATGALMSPTSTKQGNSIPGVAHGVYWRCKCEDPLCKGYSRAVCLSADHSSYADPHSCAAGAGGGFLVLQSITLMRDNA